AGRAGLVQLIRVSSRRTRFSLRTEWTGRPRLGRAEYTQITEGGPLPSPAAAPREGREGDVLWIDDRALEGAVAFALPGPVQIDAGGSALLVVAVASGTQLADVVAESRALGRVAAVLAIAEGRSGASFCRGVGLVGRGGRKRVTRDGVA